jgi:hypothetical protein
MFSKAAARSAVCVLTLAVAAHWACDDAARDGSPDASHDDREPLRDAAAADASASSTPSQGARPEGVALCYSALSSAHEATLAHWTALRGGRLEDRAAVIADLAQAATEYPEEEELALLHGLANLWRVAEPLPEQVADQGGLITAATTARSELERAYELCPTDHRIPAWLGPVLVNTGRALMDDATIENGLAVLQQGIDHYPSFVLFSKLLVFADRPKSDPDFQQALDAVFENVAVCEAGDPACTNHAHAAHNVEGASVFLGDVLAKAGDAAMARGFYEMAMQSPDYASWDYQALLLDRLENLDARVQAYETEALDDDPEAVWTSDKQCSICHRE